MKCLEKEPKKRYNTAREVADELRRFLHGQPILSHPVSSSERAWRWSKRNPAAAALLLVTSSLPFVILGVAGTTWATVAARRASDRAEQAEFTSRVLREQLQEMKKGQDMARRLRQQLRVMTVKQVSVQSLVLQEEAPVEALLLAMEAVQITRDSESGVVPVAYTTLLRAYQKAGGAPLVFESYGLSSDSENYPASEADIQTLMESSQQLAGRELTQEERKKYMLPDAVNEKERP